MNVPQLRFDGFKDKWNSTTLGEISTVQTGPFGSQLHNADYVKVGTPIITVEHFGDNRIIHKNLPLVSDADKVRLKKYSLGVGDIVFSRVGSIDRRVIVRQEEDGWLFSGRCLRVRVKDNITNKKYLSYYLGTKKVLNEIQSKAVGGTMPSLNTAILSSVNINLPKRDEQDKIALFFDLINLKIEKQQEKIEKLEQLKKGMMQKIFSQELRFKDEDGGEFPEWEEKKLSDISLPVKRTLDEINYQMPVLTISAGKGFLNQTDRFSQVIAGESLSKYTLLRKGELSYNRGASKAFPFGCIYSLQSYQEALVPNVYRSFQLFEGYETSFYEHLFSTGYANKQLRQFVSSSARLDGLLNINQDDFFTLKVPVPSADEQRIIGKYLSELDKKIEKEQEKLMVLEEQKKGFMQKIFI